MVHSGERKTKNRKNKHELPVTFKQIFLVVQDTKQNRQAKKL